MKLFILLIITFFALSCAEKHYLKKSLSRADKIYLRDGYTLIKKFSGKTNWYRQYWTGKFAVVNTKRGFDIKQIGEWRQTSKDGLELYTIANIDEFGYLVDQRILGDEGMPPISETYCKKDTVHGQIRLVCESIRRYQTGQLKEKGKWIIVNDKGTKEGKWEYYTESGSLEKVVEHTNDQSVR